MSHKELNTPVTSPVELNDEQLDQVTGGATNTTIEYNTLHPEGAINVFQDGGIDTKFAPEKKRQITIGFSFQHTHNSP
jgi:hypothetical protein